MHEQNGAMAEAGRSTCQPPENGLEEWADVAKPLAACGAQHGAGMADSAQPSAGQRHSDRDTEGNMEAVCPERRVGGCDACQPCEAERLASVGDAPCQRRQPVHPEGQADVVKPQGPVSTDNVLQLLESQQYRCALTGRELTPDTSALDHIIPIRCDGEHVIENTQVLHKDVNRAKGSMTNVEFIGMCEEVVTHAAGSQGGRP